MPLTTMQVVLQILALAAQYGIPAVTSVIEGWSKEVITQEDIDGLALLIKPPEEYK
jgi:hypothetical protein